MKVPIKVFVRFKPTNKFATENIHINEETGEINIKIEKNKNAGIINHQQENWNFNFSKLLINECQENVFDYTSKEIVKNAINGLSGCILAYGQTGAGKTFTITGSNNDYKYRGILPRIISKLYQEIEKKEEYIINIKAYYIEIYNENIYDLLSPKNKNFDENNDNVVIQEDVKYGVFPKGAIIRECKNEEDALNVMFEGDTNRIISEHKLNKSSSRSHTIYTLILESRSRIESLEKIKISKINVVDLAGSERTKKTGSDGQVILEASFINKSLSYLEQLVISLLEKNRDYIPYRQSKLNYILKDSIGGNSKTHFIANIWPEKNHLEETISTLKFSSKMMKISNFNTENEIIDEKKLLKKYEKQIKDLKLELAMHDTLAGRGRISYEPYNEEEQYKQQKIAEEFLNGEVEDIDIESIRQVKELFFQFRNIFRSKIKIINENYHDESSIKKMKNIESLKKNDEEFFKEKVGIEEKNFGFGIGKAPNESKPQYKLEKSLINVNKSDKLEETNNFDKFNKDDDNIDSESKEYIDKHEEFIRFKENQGRIYIDNHEKYKNEINEYKKKFENDSYKGNIIKQEIEELKILHDNKYNEGNNENVENVEDEQYKIIREIKDKKKQYKNILEKISLYKNNIKNWKKKKSDCEITLVDKFELYLKEKYNIYINENKMNQELVEKQSSKYSYKLTEEEKLFSNAREKFDLLQKAKKIERMKGG